MSVQVACDILCGCLPMPEDMTVEAVFQAAHITPHPPTPF